MSEHKAFLLWERKTADFQIQSYNRSHTWDFGHGNLLNASAAPQYLGDEERVDPEQAFTASLSSCHMLTFLAIASKKGFVVNRYEDHAIGHLDKNKEGILVITEVILHPKITFEGKLPDATTLSEMHDKAHHNCFLANSVKCAIKVLPQS